MKSQSYERVIYDKNPLIEVICQVRFPTVLRIANQGAFEFQEKIQSDYPFCQKLESSSNNICNFIFRSENSKWQVSLTENTLALSTLEYEKYEDFREKFVDLTKLLETTYTIPFYVRVGLRYRDLILRSELNIKDEPWLELIDESLILELKNPYLSDKIESINKSIEIKIDSSAKLRFNHGIVTAQDPEQMKEEEEAYLLDYDFYVEGKVSKNDVFNRIDQFKQEAGTRFRYSITQKLHDAMSPRPI